MSCLVDQVRRSLELPHERRGHDSGPTGLQRPAVDSHHALSSSQVVYRLQRKIAAIERRGSPRLPPASNGTTACEAPGRWTAPPKPAHEPQRLYREVFDADHALGNHRARCPSPRQLAQLREWVSIELPDAAFDNAEEALGAEDILFIDTETTGLSRGAGTLPFIIGVGGFWGPNAQLQVDQILVRDPSSETEALQLLGTYLNRARLLVSYNGRAFDLPVLRNRAVLNRLNLETGHPHLDLLFPCRRHFAARLCNCRLKTIERSLLRFEREGDIDGAEAPEIYAHYLRTGHFDRMQRVLEHNRIDVAVLAVVLRRLIEHVLDPLQWAEDAYELHATGRYHLRQANAALGRRCMERALEMTRTPELRKRLLTELARQARRDNDIDQACSRWQQYRDEFPQCNAGWVELAKLHEHQTRDLQRALAAAEGAPQSNTPDAQRRLARLRKRLQRTETYNARP